MVHDKGGAKGATCYDFPSVQIAMHFVKSIYVSWIAHNGYGFTNQELSTEYSGF